jgi:diketogulonate reductase-like aldo/keto reductase
MKATSVFSLVTAATATLPTKEIAPGIAFPIVNIGTWLAGSRKEDAHEINKNWLAQGFRGIDTALIYNDQGDIAKAITESGIAREDLFITSKIPGCFTASASVDSDLKQLNTDYIDLMLIHSPIGGGNCKNTWKVLEDYVAQGKLKSIGVSNFHAKQMQQVMDKATVPIAVNQIEYNVFSHDEDIIAFCDAHNITVEAYSPLSGQRGAQSVFTDETVKGIAATHNVSAAQVALRWIVQRGHTLAVLSSSSEHQANDADLWSFELADDEMDTLTKLQEKSVVV